MNENLCEEFKENIEELYSFILLKFGQEYFSLLRNYACSGECEMLNNELVDVWRLYPDNQLITKMLDTCIE